MRYEASIQVGDKEVSINSPTYFIADVASNHDGDLEKAKELIWLAKNSGADAVKFQHFKAEEIVSDYGFKTLGSKFSHQSKWDDSVFNIYKKYECNRDWNEELVKTAKEAKIEFMTTPYDYAAIDMLDNYLSAYKIGSGDITWIDFIQTVAKKKKPVFLATGASEIQDVKRAVEAILQDNNQLVLMQCNTNYTGSLENFKYINLNVLKTYANLYPNMILGLSDHTPGHSTVLGAITLGARVIEKHFTDDNNRKGPDHPFSMNPKTWKEMVGMSRELEYSLGDGIKKVEENELDTVVVQQRSLRLTRCLSIGETIMESDLESLRPSPNGSIKPYELPNILGKKVIVHKEKSDVLYWDDLEERK